MLRVLDTPLQSSGPLRGAPRSTILRAVEDNPPSSPLFPYFAHLSGLCPRRREQPKVLWDDSERLIVGQRTILVAAKTLGMFQPPESLNRALIERMTPSMNSSFQETVRLPGHKLDSSTI